MSPLYKSSFFFLLLSVALTGCGPSKKEREEALKARIFADMAREQKQRRDRAEQDFKGISDPELAGLFVRCKQEILSAAREAYRPYEPYFVDEYSADRLQAATHLSGGKVLKDDDTRQRVKATRKAIQSLTSDQYGHAAFELNSRYQIMVVEGKFSEPQRKSLGAGCELGPGRYLTARLDRGF